LGGGVGGSLLVGMIAPGPRWVLTSMWLEGRRKLLTPTRPRRVGLEPRFSLWPRSC